MFLFDFAFSALHRRLVLLDKTIFYYRNVHCTSNPKIKILNTIDFNLYEHWHFYGKNTVKCRA